MRQFGIDFNPRELAQLDDVLPVPFDGGPQYIGVTVSGVGHRDPGRLIAGLALAQLIFLAHDVGIHQGELFNHRGVGLPGAFVQLAFDGFGTQCRLLGVIVVVDEVGQMGWRAPAHWELHADDPRHFALALKAFQSLLPIAVEGGRSILQVFQLILGLPVCMLCIVLFDDRTFELLLGTLPALSGFGSSLGKCGELAPSFFKVCCLL